MVGRKSEQCLAQAESIWNAIGQPHWSPETSLVLLSQASVLRTPFEGSGMSQSSVSKSQSSVVEAFHVWKIFKNTSSPIIKHKSSESSDCAITSNNKSLSANKVA